MFPEDLPVRSVELIFERPRVFRTPAFLSKGASGMPQAPRTYPRVGAENNWFFVGQSGDWVGSIHCIFVWKSRCHVVGELTPKRTLANEFIIVFQRRVDSHYDEAGTTGKQGFAQTRTVSKRHQTWGRLGQSVSRGCARACVTNSQYQGRPWLHQPEVTRTRPA